MEQKVAAIDESYKEWTELQVVYVCVIFLMSVIGSALGFRHWFSKKSEFKRYYGTLVTSLVLGLVAVFSVGYIVAALLLIDSID